MLKKEFRLKKKKEFNFIYKRGEVFYSKFLALYVAKTKYKNSKFGFVVGHKVGNSVIRHKVKRRLSEVVKDYVLTVPTNNYIFVAKSGCEQLDFEGIKQNIEYILKKANLV